MFGTSAAFSNSLLSKSSNASAMIAIMTLTMCSTNKYPKERFMITLTLPKFILQCRTLNQHNELRTRTFGFAVSVSSECFINEAYKKQMPN
jgi:hypothetical protein